MEKVLENLEKLCMTPGISGNEVISGISDIIFNIVKSINENTIMDKRGNVISVIGRGKKKVLIDAHLDEVGFYVSKKDTAKLEVSPIGNINLKEINKSACYILGKGIEGELLYDRENLFLVIKEAIDYKKIFSGDLISFARSFALDRNIVEATALDDRIGCACLISLLDLIKRGNTKDLEIVFTFTTDEETDGAILDEIASLYDVDFGIIVDAAYAKPVSFDTEGMQIPELGKGCAVQYIGNNFVIDKDIIKKIEDCAIKQNISFQREIPIPNLGRTNFSKFQRTSKPGCVINIPVCSQHKQISKADIRDLESAQNLILSVLDMFDSDKLA